MKKELTYYQTPRKVTLKGKDAERFLEKVKLNETKYFERIRKTLNNK